MVVNLYEDNQAVLQIIRTGKNMTMRHCERTHRVPVAWLHELYTANQDTYFKLHFAKSEQMVADLFTKAFTDVNKFTLLRSLTGIGLNVKAIRGVTEPMMANRGRDSHGEEE